MDLSNQNAKKLIDALKKRKIDWTWSRPSETVDGDVGIDRFHGVQITQDGEYICWTMNAAKDEIAQQPATKSLKQVLAFVSKVHGIKPTNVRVKKEAITIRAWAVDVFAYDWDNGETHRRRWYRSREQARNAEPSDAIGENGRIA